MSKESLKQQFKNGEYPDETVYAELIDLIPETSGANSQDFENETPSKVATLNGENIYKFYQNVALPSLADYVEMPIPLGAEIVSFSAKYRKYSNPMGDFIFITTEIVKTPQNRYNLMINDVYYQESGTKISVKSFKAEFVQESAGGTKKVVNWSGTPVEMILDTISSKSFRIHPKFVEITDGNYTICQTDYGSLLNMPTIEGIVTGKVRYEKNPRPERDILSLDLKSNTQNFRLDTSELLADSEKLIITCEYKTT